MSKIIRQRSIGRRVFIWVISLSAICTFLSAGWEIYVAVKQKEIIERQALVEIVESLTPSINVAIWNVDEHTISTILESIAFRPEVAYVNFEVNGALINRRDVAQDIVISQEAICDNRLHFDFRKNEPFGQALNTGQLAICLSSSSFSRLDLQATLRSAVPRFLTVLIVAFGTLFILQKQVIQRLISISNRLRTDDSFSNQEITSILDQAEVDELDCLIIELVSRTKRLEEAQMKLVNTEKVEAVGRLTSGVAHEFNNILAIVMGNLEMLQLETGMSEAGVRYINRAISSTRRAADVTDQLLKYASPSREKTALVSLKSMLPTIRSNAYPFLGPDITMECYCGSEYTVNVNKTDLENAVTNLVKNSSEALSGKGKISLSIRTPSTFEVEKSLLDPDIVYVVIDITDDGSGIAEQVRKNMFNPFFTTKTTSGGTGLGLWTVYRFAEQSSGRLVYIPKNIGSCFLIFLPLIIVPTVETMTYSEVVEENRFAKASLSNKRVLIVDDELELLELITAATKEVGARTYTATTVAQAISILDNQEIDILVCDLILPDGLGTIVCEHAKQTNEQTITLLISGNLPNHAGLSDAIDTALLKPVRLEKYFESIQVALPKESVS